MMILDPGLNDTAIAEKTAFVKDWIEKLDGKIINAKDIGIEKLSYEIKKSMQGHYVQFNFEMDSLKIDEFKKELKLEESIWRTLLTADKAKKVTNG